MNNPSSIKKYQPPSGRLATVQSIQNYSRVMKIRPQDYISSDVKRNPKMNKQNDYKQMGMVGTFPAIHRDTPKLQNGKAKKIFKDDKLFEIEKKDSKKQSRQTRKKPEKGIHRKVILDYKSEFHAA